MNIPILKTSGNYTLEPIEQFMRYASDGTYMFSVKKIRKSRTLNQNEWLWGCVYPMLLDGLNDIGWEFTTTEQVHEFMKSHFADDAVLNTNTGEVVTLPKSTAEMDTMEFSTYVDKIREFAIENLDMVIPDPDTEWKIK